MEILVHNMAPIMFAALVLFLLLGYPVAFALAANGLFFGIIGIELGLFAPNFLQALPERVYGIMNGTFNPPGMNADVSQLTPDQRSFLADQWLQRSGNAPGWQQAQQLQQAYEAQHPEFAQFKDWQRFPPRTLPLVWTHRSGRNRWCSAPPPRTSKAWTCAKAARCSRACATGPRNRSSPTATNGRSATW